MSQFGINGGNSDYGQQAATFGGAVTSALKTLVSNGTGANRDLGNVTVRQESRKTPEGQATLSAAAQSAQAMASAIVATLDFESNPGTNAGAVGFGATAGQLKIRQEAMAGRAAHAAQLGYALASGYQALEGRELGSVPVTGNGMVMPSAMTGGHNKVTLRQEAFNNIDVRRSVAYSMGFNAAITRQTDVIMAWFPPIFINPDQVALEISLNVLTVFNGAHHEISGAATPFARRNVARAFADPTILNRYETLAVPVSRAENVAMFVDTAVVAHSVQEFGSRKVTTAPLKFDTDINLLGISTTDALLQTGAQNQRDTLEPGAKMKAIYFKSGTDIIKLSTLGLKTGVFVGAQQGDQQETLLNMRTRLAVGKFLTQYDGDPLAGPLKAIVDGDLRLKLAVQVTGVMNVETGNTKVNKPSMALVALVSAATGQEITSGAVFTAVKNAVAAFEYLGFETRAYRTNANRRQTGDRLNTRRFNFHYVVPYRDPITAERPAHKQEEQDAQDLTNLLALTRVRIENEGIAQIIETAETLEAYVDMRDTDAEATDVVGLAQYYLIPTFAKGHIQLETYVDSIKSADRAKDIQAAIVTKLRDVAARLYTDSQFKAGTDIQSGGTLPKPQVNVLTDPILARYILEPGELRTLGDFEMVLTTSLNYKLRGQLFMSFRMPGQESANEPCIFNFGHLVMSPELVLAANMTREGSYFAETQVQPRYEFMVLNPIMARLQVNGVKEVLSKVPYLTTLTDPLKIDGVVQMKTVP